MYVCFSLISGSRCECSPSNSRANLPLSELRHSCASTCSHSCHDTCQQRHFRSETSDVHQCSAAIQVNPETLHSLHWNWLLVYSKNNYLLSLSVSIRSCVLTSWTWRIERTQTNRSITFKVWPRDCWSTTFIRLKNRHGMSYRLVCLRKQHFFFFLSCI